jgi:hypothetical protein
VSPAGTPDDPTVTDREFNVVAFVADPIVPTRVGGGGGTFTVKSFALQPVPPGVVTQTLPVLAPVGTVAEIEVAESTV